MARMTHAPLDANGRPIAKGDRVRILSIPDLSGMSAEGIEECKPAFEYLVGKYRTVLGFNDYGLAEIRVCGWKGPFPGNPTVWLEPNLLTVKPKL